VFAQTGGYEIMNEALLYNVDTNNMNIHEKTLIIYVSRYLTDPMFSYSVEQWREFFAFYNIDFKQFERIVIDEGIIEKTIAVDGQEINAHDRIEERQLVDDMFRYISTTQFLCEIKFDDTEKSLSSNIKRYTDIAHNITMINANIGTRKYFAKEPFDRMRMIQKEIENIHSVYWMLRNIEANMYQQTKDLLVGIYHVSNEYISTHLDTLYVVLSLQVISCSPLANTDEINTCKQLSNILIKLLNKARILAFYKNPIQFDKELEWTIRGKEDNTTRLLLLYEYHNGDQYSLRFDLAHKGVKSFHLNICSKGGVEYFPLDYELYEKVISNDNEYVNWFIEYESGLYFMRECKKNEIHDDEHISLKEVMEVNQHFYCSQFENEPILLNIIERWISVSISVGSWAPYCAVNPTLKYRLSFVYNYIAEYVTDRMSSFDLDEDNFKRGVIYNLIEAGLIDFKDYEVCEMSSAMDVLLYTLSNHITQST